MASYIPLRTTNLAKQALYFLGPKIWTKISHNIKNVKTTASFTHAQNREILSKLSWYIFRDGLMEVRTLWAIPASCDFVVYISSYQPTYLPVE